MANEKKTTTTTTVKTLKGKIPPISPMKSAEFYAEQANQTNQKNAKPAKPVNSQTSQQSKQLLKRFGIAGGIVALLLGVLFAVEHFNKPETPEESLPPLSSPLVIPDAPSVAENNQNQNQTQNLDLNPQDIIPQIENVQEPENNIALVNPENPENNSPNLVENQAPAAADSFGAFSEPEPTPSQAKTDNNSMQQGGHTILKLNPQPLQNQQTQQTIIKPIQQNTPKITANVVEKTEKSNNEKSNADKSATDRKLLEMQQNKQSKPTFIAEETSAPPILGTNKTAPALPDRNNLPNTRIVSTQSQIQITSAEKSIIPENKFRIQAGVFDSKVNPQSAETLYQKLVSAGIPAVLENRVQVGPFSNRDQAEKARQKLKELGINDAVIVMPKN